MQVRSVANVVLGRVETHGEDLLLRLVCALVCSLLSGVFYALELSRERNREAFLLCAAFYAASAAIDAQLCMRYQVQQERGVRERGLRERA